MYKFQKYNKLNFRYKLGLLIISLSVLLLEFTLIRVLSVSLWYHFAFMIISIALLGFGISGVMLSIFKNLLKIPIDQFLTYTSLLYSLSVIFVFYFTNQIPFDPFSLLVDNVQFLYLPLYYILMIFPFFAAGLIIGRLFIDYKSNIGEVYFYDLVGAGLSCLVFIIVIPAFGGSGAVITAALVGMTAFFIFNSGNKKFQLPLILISIFYVLVLSYFLTDADNYLPIRISDNKVYGNYIKQYEQLRILTKWNSFSRVDVLEDNEAPIDDYPIYLAIIDAGNSTTNIPRVTEIRDSMAPPMDASNLAMILKKDTANVFIVGSGGGGEIVSALAHNARSVTAVEINGLLNDLIKKNFANYWTKGLANNKKVNIVTDDARSYLRSKRIKYDVIISAHTISSSAIASGAMSLVENYILTEEAITEYLHHLKTNGILYITRPESQLPRLVSTLISSYEDIAKLDSKNNFFIFKRPASGFEGKESYLSGIVYKKDGFTEYDIIILKTQAAILGLELVYDPVSKQDGIYKDMIENGKLNELRANHTTKLEPATDNNPYFEHQVNFTDLNAGHFEEAFSQKEKAMVTLNQRPVAEVTLLFILIQIAIISAVLLLLPLYLKFRKDVNYKKEKKGKYLLYFGGIGLAYIMIEIALIQRFTLFLGQPVYTMLTVISSMLIFSGIGSMLSNKFLNLIKGNYLILFGSIALLTVLIGLFNQFIFDTFVRADIIWKVIISILLIAPLSFLMGIPFPTAFRAINKELTYINAYAWAINGFFSVIGSVLVIILSMSYGFKLVFVLTALIYLGLTFVIKRFQHSAVEAT